MSSTLVRLGAALQAAVDFGLEPDLADALCLRFDHRGDGALSVPEST